ncbi:hypothetical protein SAMN06295879_2409 [Agreia bicolorata]|uniref:Uncharacterized protein n=1 Tax=Agreia bicolorata TaxID=110935 RepID=A0A1T4Y753_9MICO|nr:Ig-like domain-containing protein [Agreia bicolorata]SKA97637.1 hypothetical protein SAMN06295879_2409 [Agreia bicolorata]
MRIANRRTRRGIGSITGALALVIGLSSILPTAAAEAATEPTPQSTATDALAGTDALGAPVRLLIESVHATGKVLEIGNANAQKTEPNNTLAAAAIFTRASTPADLTSQLITAYPVAGASDTYIFASADGKVLVRNPNDSPVFRYLSISAETPTEAAGDPYAQWKAVDAGGGAVYLTNVQRDANGNTAALDMYNWKTDDGSEIQTYDQGTGAVQKWFLRSITPEVAAISGRTETGVVPTPPTSQPARYSWGTTVTMSPLTWAMPDPASWNTDGTVTITGTGIGYFGEEVPVTAEYLVGSAGDAADSTLNVYAGITLKQLQMLAPTRVERSVSGSQTTITAPVTWDWSSVTDETLATPGTITVTAAASTGFAAKLVITVAATEKINIARAAGIHFKSLFGTGTGLNDGTRDKVGFSDWRSGGASNRVNPNKVMYYFDQPRQITGAAIFDQGSDSKLNVGGVTIQYRTITGGWKDLPATGIQWPYQNATPQLSLTVDSTSVLATGARAIFTNKTSSTWMSLAEFEVYGPDFAAPASTTAG